MHQAVSERELEMISNYFAQLPRFKVILTKDGTEISSIFVRAHDDEDALEEAYHALMYECREDMFDEAYEFQVVKL